MKILDKLCTLYKPEFKVYKIKMQEVNAFQ